MDIGPLLVSMLDLHLSQYWGSMSFGSARHMRVSLNIGPQNRLQYIIMVMITFAPEKVGGNPKHALMLQEVLLRNGSLG